MRDRSVNNQRVVIVPQTWIIIPNTSNIKRANDTNLYFFWRKVVARLRGSGKEMLMDLGVSRGTWASFISYGIKTPGQYYKDY